MTETPTTTATIFDSREALTRAIETGKNSRGGDLSEAQINRLETILAHPDFDTWAPWERRREYDKLANGFQLTAPRSPSNMAGEIGWSLLGFGGILIIISLIMKTSVSMGDGGLFSTSTSEVVNIGLLQNQLMVFQAGLALLIGGIVLLTASLVRAELRELAASAAESTSKK